MSSITIRKLWLKVKLKKLPNKDSLRKGIFFKTSLFIEVLVPSLLTLILTDLMKTNAWFNILL